jgi:hypothetical protein
MKAGGSLSVQAFGQLESVREFKKTQLEQYLANRRADLDVLKETVEALRGGAFEKLESVQELKKAQFEEYFTKVRADVLALSKSDDIYRMFSELRKYHDKVHTGPSDPYGTASDEYRRLSETDGAYLESFVKEASVRLCSAILRCRSAPACSARCRASVASFIKSSEARREALSASLAAVRS